MLASAPVGGSRTPSEPVPEASRPSSLPIPLSFPISAPLTPILCLTPRRGEAPLLWSRPSLHSSHSALAERQWRMRMGMGGRSNNARRPTPPPPPLLCSCPAPDALAHLPLLLSLSLFISLRLFLCRFLTKTHPLATDPVHSLPCPPSDLAPPPELAVPLAATVPLRALSETGRGRAHAHCQIHKQFSA